MIAAADDVDPYADLWCRPNAFDLARDRRAAFPMLKRPAPQTVEPRQPVKGYPD